MEEAEGREADLHAQVLVLREQAKTSKEWQRVIEQLHADLQDKHAEVTQCKKSIQQHQFQVDDLLKAFREEQTAKEYLQTSVKSYEAESQRLRAELQQAHTSKHSQQEDVLATYKTEATL